MMSIFQSYKISALNAMMINIVDNYIKKININYLNLTIFLCGVLMKIFLKESLLRMLTIL